jgi:NifU-like protein
MDGEKVIASANTEDFKSMSVVRQTKAIEKVLDEHIRPMLVMDGGNLELLDIKDEGHEIQVFIRYMGACNGCASSSTGTLYAIEAVLRRELYPEIRVLPV